MTNAELVSFALGFGLASMVILTIGALLLRKWYNEVFNELQPAVQPDEIPVITIRVECIGKVLYCYDENDIFICQGSSLVEIEEAYKERFPNHPSCILRLKGDTKMLEEVT